MYYNKELLTRAWNLDKDTHDYLRKYINIFIYKMILSKEYKIYFNTCSKLYCPHSPNPLRRPLNRLDRYQEGYPILNIRKESALIPIDQIHKTNYYSDDGIKGVDISSKIDYYKAFSDPKNRSSNLSPDHAGYKFDILIRYY